MRQVPENGKGVITISISKVSRTVSTSQRSYLLTQPRGGEPSLCWIPSLKLASVFWEAVLLHPASAMVRCQQTAFPSCTFPIGIIVGAAAAKATGSPWFSSESQITTQDPMWVHYWIKSIVEILESTGKPFFSWVPAKFMGNRHKIALRI